MQQQNSLVAEILDHFPYNPTQDQTRLIEALVSFLLNQNHNSLFLLKGYAGTGKTTIISSLVNILRKRFKPPVLLAPTGRAAKVLAAYSADKAFTIHKKIYRIVTHPDGRVEIVLQQNKHTDTLFIVDEASMISYGGYQEKLFGAENILDDLMKYVYSGKGCRLIFTGDAAQLPPVGVNESPALNPEWLHDSFHLQITYYEMRQVVRQTSESGILHNATIIRQMLLNNHTGYPKFRLADFPDFLRLQNHDLEEHITTSFNQKNLHDSLVICRTNKRAYLFNKNIRERVLFMEEEVDGGDMLMVVKNNYFWLPSESDAGFIANGDLMTINRIRRNEEMYGMRFADVQASLTDYPEEPDLEVRIILNTLDTEGAALRQHEIKNLFEAIASDYPTETSQPKRYALTRENPYFQALQVKYGYALTCHKAQGGQWKNVYVDMGFLRETKPDKEYLRWLYTAITRATEKVMLINFPDQFFE